MYLTIGPAINCGKKMINNENFLKFRLSKTSSYASTKKARVWKVTKLKANGNGIFKYWTSKLKIIFTLLIIKSAYLKNPKYERLKIIAKIK